MVQTQPATSPNLVVKLVEANASGQYTRVNELVYTVDALVQATVKDKDLATPPGSPAEGDRYIVAGSPTGAWAGWAKRIAGYYNGAWLSWVPKEGWRTWIDDEDKYYKYDGSSWVEDTGTTTAAPTWTVVSKTASFTISTSEAAVYIVDASSGNVTITLLAASGVGSRAWMIKRVDSSANTVTIDGNGSETIDGALTVTLDKLQSITLVCNSTTWYIL